MENKAGKSFERETLGGGGSSPKSENSFFKSVRYRFDNSIVKPGVFILYALIALIVLSILNTALSIWVHSTSLGVTTEPFDFWEQLFQRMWLTLGREYVSENWADRVERLATWITNVSINALVIGFAASSFTSFVQKVRAGNATVVISNHTVILGWSNQVFSLLKELSLANASARKPTVVIFSTKTREHMEVEIASRAGNLGNLRVVTREGDTTNPSDLRRANIASSKSIIVLDSPENGSAGVISSVLAVQSIEGTQHIPLIAEVEDSQVAETLDFSRQGLTNTVKTQEIISRVTAQSCRQPGLSTVVFDLLDFEGDEIYFSQIPELEGKRYSEALNAFSHASVIGIRDSHGVISLNPGKDYLIPSGSQVIAVAADDDKLVFTGLADIAPATTRTRKTAKPKTQNILVIGWSSMGQRVVTELASFLPSGSSVHIMVNNKFVAEPDLKILKFANLKMTSSAFQGEVHEVLAMAKSKQFDHILVLGYRDTLSLADADAQTLLTIMQLKTLFKNEHYGLQSSRIVAELLDARKVNITRVDSSDDLLVSENLAALLVAQISENPALAQVIADLFDAEGASINMRPVELYAEPGATVSYAQLVAAGSERNESVIGYRVSETTEQDEVHQVHLNPIKSKVFKVSANDTVIVVGSMT